MLAWTSLITTNGSGDPKSEAILEVGVYVTNEEPPYRQRGAVGYPLATKLPIETYEMHPDVVAEIEASGLAGFRQIMQVDPVDAEEEIIELMYRYDEPGFFVMAGHNTQKVREWLKWQLPDLYKMYGPHNLDLSGFDQVVKYAGVSDEYKFNDYIRPGRAIKDAEYYYRTFLHYAQGLQR